MRGGAARVSVPPMRLVLFTLAAFVGLLPLLSGCDSKARSADALIGPPAAYAPETAPLTFNKEGLEAFNLLDADQQDAFVQDLASKPGSFKGQALVSGSAGLGSAIAESQYGDWEVLATTRRPVLYEIVIDYSIYTSVALGRPLAENRAVSFNGTLVSAEYKNDAKPRKLILKVKADDIQPITD